MKQDQFTTQVHLYLPIHSTKLPGCSPPLTAVVKTRTGYKQHVFSTAASKHLPVYTPVDLLQSVYWQVNCAAAPYLKAFLERGTARHAQRWTCSGPPHPDDVCTRVLHTLSVDSAVQGNGRTGRKRHTQLANAQINTAVKSTHGQSRIQPCQTNHQRA